MGDPEPTAFERTVLDALREIRDDIRNARADVLRRIAEVSALATTLGEAANVARSEAIAARDKTEDAWRMIEHVAAGTGQAEAKEHEESERPSRPSTPDSKRAAALDAEYESDSPNRDKPTRLPKPGDYTDIIPPLPDDPDRW